MIMQKIVVFTTGQFPMHLLKIAWSGFWKKNIMFQQIQVMHALQSAKLKRLLLLLLIAENAGLVVRNIKLPGLQQVLLIP